MKILSPKGHGYIDYLFVLALFAAPEVFEFRGTPATVCYVIACVHLLLTVGTDAPFGLVRAVAFPLHGIFEFFAAIVLMGLPWILGVSGNETLRNFFVGSGLFVLAIFLITDYRKMRAV